MASPKKIDSCKIGSWLSLICFFCFSLIWMMSSYQYHIIRYQEEIQLFRTDFLYLQDFIQIPGGIISYLASFLTQFYHYPFLGVLIFTLGVVILYILLLVICNLSGNIYRFYILPFIVPLIAVFIYSDTQGIYFALAHLFGLITALLAFYIFLKGSIKYKYVSGIMLYILVYFIAGGNALILGVLMLLNEFFNKKKSYIFILLLIVVSLLVPYIAYKFIYLIPLEKAYFSLTPFELLGIPNLYLVLWFSIPLIYLVWLCICRIPLLFKTAKPVALIVFYTCIIIGFGLWGVNDYKKQEAEQIARIAYEVEHANWEEVLKLTENADMEKNPLFPYFRNIALSEKGTLIPDMFKAIQTGTYGLFNEWKLRYANTLFIGEMYYWLGLVSAAEQCAFEAMITSPEGNSSKALRRLVQTSILRKDRDSFEKYIRLFEKSPVYKKWAIEQREIFQSYLASEDPHIVGFPKPLKFENFFFYTDNQEQNLITLMKYNPDNRKVFEYLAAFLLLRKNLFEFQMLLDDYYFNMGYPQLPKAFEEAIIILIYNERKELVEKYNIPYSALERFVKFNEDISTVKSNTGISSLRNKYKESYWLYFKYWKPMTLDEITRSSVY